MVAACTASNPAFDVSSATGGTTDPSTSTTGPVPGETSLPGTSDASESDQGDDTTTTTGSSVSESDVESSGAPACEIEEQARLDVSLHEGQSAVPLCGDTIILEGDVAAIDDATWSIAACGCGNPKCDAAYTLAISAPSHLLPVPPPCARIEIHGVATPDGCELASLRIHASNGPVDPVNDPPLYLASRGRTNGDGAVQPGVFVSEQLIEGCPCPEDGCCPIEPGRYELGFFTGVEGDEVAWLAEGDELTGRGAIPIAPFPSTSLWDVAALNAHVHPMCGMRPHFDWIIRASAG